MLKIQHDWQGHIIPENESPETVIFVWEVPALQGEEYDTVLIRGWQDMLEYVSQGIELFLGDISQEDLENNIHKIHFQLKRMTKAEYLEIQETDYA